MLDVVLTIINVLLAVLSGIGAYKSVKYFQKSKNITIYAQTNKALLEVQKMLVKLPEVLSASNLSSRGKKGYNFSYNLCNIGKELNANLTEITSDIPPEYMDELQRLLKKDDFNLYTYINSYMSGEAVIDNGIDAEVYNLCQDRLMEMQNFLKKIASETEEKLK